MNIKQKLTWAFAIIACLPVVLVATLVVLNLRSDAREGFVDSSGRGRKAQSSCKLHMSSTISCMDYPARSSPRVQASRKHANRAMLNARNRKLKQNPNGMKSGICCME